MRANLLPTVIVLAAGGIAAGATLFAAHAVTVEWGQRAPVKELSEERDPARQIRRRLEARLPELAKRVQIELRDDVVVLTGVVDSLPKKQIADEAARSVRGISNVDNQLLVEMPPQPDEAVTRFVETALRSDPATLGLDINVSVRDGVVTLQGHVDTVPQKRIAAWVASGLVGVQVVSNLIQVKSEARRDREIYEELQQYYQNDPLYNDDEIKVEVKNGVVSLIGQVDSALELNWARDEAWVRGVRRVNADRLQVHYTPSLSHAGRATPLTDEEIRQAITKAYVYDPRVASVNPEVRVDGGEVTLQGVISNRKAKQAAVQIARNTGGVTNVIDHMRVQSDIPRTDSEIRDAIQTAHRTSAALARNELKVAVESGRVELSGTVDSPYERWVAGDLADRTRGVVEVENNLQVRGSVGALPLDYSYPRGGATTPWLYSRAGAAEAKSDAELVAGVRKELSRSAFTNGDGIRVEANHGVVTLEGKVASWAARGAAVEAAYQAGANAVVAHLNVASRR